MIHRNINAVLCICLGSGQMTFAATFDAGSIPLFREGEDSTYRPHFKSASFIIKIGSDTLIGFEVEFQLRVNPENEQDLSPVFKGNTSINICPRTYFAGFLNKANLKFF